MIKLSACVIMRDEEENIINCLRSLVRQVDEIVVVDTGSIDKSVAMAREYTEKIYIYNWDNDFSAAKNFALEKANGDWIIFLDADEYFSEECQLQIRAVIEKYSKLGFDGLQIPMTNIDMDQGEQKMDTFFSLRAFSKKKDLIYMGKVHESLFFLDGREKKLAYIQQNELHLYHTGYSQKRNLEKCQRNLLLLLQELKVNPKRKFIYRYLADVYYGLLDYENAEKYAKMDIARNEYLEYEASRSYRIWYEAARNLNREEVSLTKILEKCMRRFPRLPDFYAEYGLRLYHQAKYNKALFYFLKAEKLYNIYADKTEFCMLAKSINIVYKIMAEIFAYKGNLEKNLYYIEKSANY